MHNAHEQQLSKKILLAVGGTGGHLFPAQALAVQLERQRPGDEILFAGGSLGLNPFFQKRRFPFREITSSTPFRRGRLASLFKIAKGVVESLRLTREFCPDLVVGFGSFYSFPLLVAAHIRRIPYILVESNALPGKVNRLFSPGARLSALQFEMASKGLRGKTQCVKMPHWPQRPCEPAPSQAQAQQIFDLKPGVLTLLIFGGSQGARAINEAALHIELSTPFQVLHLCGRGQDAKQLEDQWKARGITARVTCFEERMHLAWRAADVVICRSGAGTCSEIIEHATAALLVPWPGASEDHQRVNAKALAKWGGALVAEQSELESALPCAVKELVEKRWAIREKLQQIRQMRGEDLVACIAREVG